MGCNPDILENIVQRAGGPRDIYFPIYPDYNPCIISIYIDMEKHEITAEIWSFMKLTPIGYSMAKWTKGFGSAEIRFLLIFFIPHV